MHPYYNALQLLTIQYTYTVGKKQTMLYVFLYNPMLFKLVYIFISYTK